VHLPGHLPLRGFEVNFMYYLGAKVKLVFYFFSTLILLTILYLTYISYLKFETYQNSLMQSKQQILVSTLSKYVEKIDYEELNAAIYSNRHNNKDFEAYKQAQEDTDILLNRIMKISKNDLDLSPLVDALALVHSNLIRIRSRVKTLEDDYKKVFIYHYYKDALVPILETLHMEEKELNMYIALEKVHSNAITEKNFIAYVLSKNNKDTTSSLKLWEKILDDKFSFNLMQNKVNISFNDMLTKYREQIVKGLFKNKNGIALNKRYYVANAQNQLFKK